MSWMSLSLLLALTGPSEPQVALLVSVDDYGSPGINLNSPAQDSALLERELAGTAFTVKRVHNVDRAGFVQTLLDTRQQVGTGVVFFYFSGHAVQVNGENWLIPRGAALKTIDQVPLEAVSVQQVLGAFSEARVRVVVLDACRTNPFGLGTKGALAGLARERLDNLDGTLISYAAAPGSVAYDGAPGSPSPFTLALVKHLKTPGLDLPNLFMEVRGELLASTRGLPNGPQRSEEVSSLTARHRVSFVPQAEVGGTKAAGTAPAGADGVTVAKAPEGRVRVLVLDFRNDGVADGTARLVRDTLVADLAEQPSIDVVSTEDIRQLLDVEASKQAIGCNQDASCIAEIAMAMGAEYSLFGNIGALGDVTVVNMSLLDSRGAKVRAREKLQSRGMSTLPAELQAAAARLAARITGQTAPAPAPPATGPSALVFVGAGTSALGALGVVAGGVMYAMNNDIVVDPRAIAAGGYTGAEKSDAEGARAAGLVVAGLGVVAVGVGGAVAYLGWE